MKTRAIIERGKDGMYSIYLDDDKFDFGLLGSGATVEEAKKDFFECCEEMKELEEADGKTFPELEFEFSYDAASFLSYYNDIISLSGLQRLTGINRKQLSHYVTGYRKPSPATVKKIQKAVHDFANELNGLSLV